MALEFVELINYFYSFLKLGVGRDTRNKQRSPKYLDYNIFETGTQQAFNS